MNNHEAFSNQPEAEWIALSAIEEEPILRGRHPDDQDLKPISGWIRTGRVLSGENGPGCSVGCIYCNQMGLDKNEQGDRMAGYISLSVDGGISLNTRLMVGSRQDRAIATEELISEIKDYPFYEPNSYVILENFNDPGLNWKQTTRLAELLVTDLKHSGPISFITKLGISDNQVEELSRVQKLGANLVGIVTYSGLPAEIEPNSPEEMRLTTMSRLKEKGIPVICSMRPLIKGINTDVETIDRVLMQVKEKVDAIIVGGLFVYDNFTIKAFQSKGFPLDQAYEEQIYSVAKSMPEDYKQLVRDRAAELGLDQVVQNHTSCAISQLMTTVYGRPTSDRAPHWVSPQGLEFAMDCIQCPDIQKTVCYERSQEKVEDVIYRAKNALSKIGYSDLDVLSSKDAPNTLLVVGGSLLFEELVYVKEQAGWYVDNLPSLNGIRHRTLETLKNDLKFSQDLVSDFILVGQEWHVVVQGVDYEQSKYLERWFRSRNRHRVCVLRLEELRDSGIEKTVEMLMQKSGRYQQENYFKDRIGKLLDGGVSLSTP